MTRVPKPLDLADELTVVRMTAALRFVVHLDCGWSRLLAYDHAGIDFDMDLDGRAAAYARRQRELFPLPALQPAIAAGGDRLTAPGGAVQMEVVA